MAYFTEQQLRDFRQPFGGRRHILTEERGAELTVFLSHSHHDRSIVEGLIAMLDQIGIKIYVDWNDKDMPRVTNRETADKIKEQIKKNAIFMILATSRALSSKWVPWEVGIGDQVKGEAQILLIPVADPSGNFQGNEYLQLYSHLIVEPKNYVDWGRSSYRIVSRREREIGSLNEVLEFAKSRGVLFS